MRAGRVSYQFARARPPASLSSAVGHNLNSLKRIQIVLTVLAVIAFVADLQLARWLHSMAYFDPVRRQWQARIEVISFILWFGVVGSCLLFSVFHLIVVVMGKARPKLKT